MERGFTDMPLVLVVASENLAKANQWYADEGYGDTTFSIKLTSGGAEITHYAANFAGGLEADHPDYVLAEKTKRGNGVGFNQGLAAISAEIGVKLAKFIDPDTL